QQTPQDVCFVFPATATKLWASSKVLVDQSAYFRSLFGGNFSESTTRTSAENTEAPEFKVDETSRLYEESDDETDEHFAAQVAKKAPLSDSNNLPHKKVVINDAAFTTYQAILVWMSSRYIPESETSLPASPKSVYRLAHLLELDELQEIALNNFRSQLTVHNAATELFSDVASAYPALRDIALDFILENWTDVRASSAWKKMKLGADARVLPTGAAYTAMLLSERIKTA
ncbi:hypothetical protein RHOSPDRAFT_23601, partial [Rhodotorula sp. JG-1b]